MACFRVNIVFAGLMVFLSSPAMAADAKLGEQVYAAKGCLGCHGPAGNSANPAAFPNISGLDAAYIKEQLEAFRSGARANPLMSPMSVGLSDDDISHLSAYLGTQ